MIWSSKEWYLGDKGTLSYPEIIDEICKNNPKHSDKLRYILDNKIMIIFYLKQHMHTIIF